MYWKKKKLPRIYVPCFDILVKTFGEKQKETVQRKQKIRDLSKWSSKYVPFKFIQNYANYTNLHSISYKDASFFLCFWQPQKMFHLVLRKLVTYIFLFHGIDIRRRRTFKDRSFAKHSSSSKSVRTELFLCSIGTYTMPRDCFRIWCFIGFDI